LLSTPDGRCLHEQHTVGAIDFHKVATKEDDYTQILCNLMKRQEGKELRTSVLSMILGNSDLASQVSPDQIDTQVSMREAGRPDLIVESPVVYAVIEVKLNPRRGLTAYQFGGYSIFFASATAPRKVLAFLVPANWQYQQLLDKDLERFKRIILQSAQRLSNGKRSTDFTSNSFQTALMPILFR